MGLAKGFNAVSVVVEAVVVVEVATEAGTEAVIVVVAVSSNKPPEGVAVFLPTPRGNDDVDDWVSFVEAMMWLSWRH